MIKFSWNPDKAAANQKKHGVSFEEAQSVFYDDFAIQFYNAQHSGTEDRFLMLGLSSQSRIIIVCHCEQDAGHAIRIISARKATKNERQYYPGNTP